MGAAKLCIDKKKKNETGWTAFNFKIISVRFERRLFLMHCVRGKVEGAGANITALSYSYEPIK